MRYHNVQYIVWGIGVPFRSNLRNKNNCYVERVGYVLPLK